MTRVTILPIRFEQKLLQVPAPEHWITGFLCPPQYGQCPICHLQKSLLLIRGIFVVFGAFYICRLFVKEKGCQNKKAVIFELRHLRLIDLELCLFQVSTSLGQWLHHKRCQNRQPSPVCRHVGAGHQTLYFRQLMPKMQPIFCCQMPVDVYKH